MSQLPPPLRRLRLVAVLAFAAQLGVLVWWRWRIWSHFSLTDDYSQYWQAWHYINHGNLNPYDSVAHHSFWHDHAVFLMWFYALITHFGLGGYAPLLVESVLVVVAEAIAFWWLLELLAERDLALPLRNWGTGAICLATLVANPWVYWGLSFDVHFDVTAALPFLVLAFRALYYRRYRQLALWATICLIGGDIAASYLAALGLAGLIVSIAPSQRRVRASLALLVVGVVWFGVLSRIGGNAGSYAIVASIASRSGHTASSHSSLLGNLGHVALHPWHLVASPLHHFRNVWSLISPAGVVGLLSPWGLILAGSIAVENNASGGYFSSVPFQYLPVFAPLAVATVLGARALSRGRWSQRTVTGLLVLSLVNTLAWSVVWLPHVRAQWLRVDDQAAQVLTEAEHLIPPDAEVVASQGVVGRFAGRQYAYAYPNNPGPHVPIMRPDVYFVLLPYQGIEVETAEATLDLIDKLAGPLHATLLLHGAGVWVFRLPATGSPQETTVDIRDAPSTTPVPAWGLHTAVGSPLLTGPARSWSMASQKRTAGYLVYGAYFNRPPGHYTLRVRMSTTGTVNLEAWNNTVNVLMDRRSVPETNGIVTATVPVDSTREYPPALFRGHFLFTRDPLSPNPGQIIEARVYLPANVYGVVYSVQLTKDKS